MVQCKFLSFKQTNTDTYNHTDTHIVSCTSKCTHRQMYVIKLCIQTIRASTFMYIEHTHKQTNRHTHTHTHTHTHIHTYLYTYLTAIFSNSHLTVLGNESLWCMVMINGRLRSLFKLLQNQNELQEGTHWTSCSKCILNCKHIALTHIYKYMYACAMHK